MKFTFDWLKDYLETDADANAIADTLTRTGLEVEDIIQAPVPIAAKIIECASIPDTHLHTLMVDDGSGTLRQVVCGAPNARVGLISALAVPGCKIDGMEIKSGKLRGVLSDGMMCSGKELGISDDHSGIIELPDNTKIGSPLLSPLLTFEAGITPNRPDYLAVRGIARDLAAAGLGRFLDHPGTDFAQENFGTRKAVIKNETACPTYRLCEIHGIKNSQSNSIIAGRLSAVGINPKNAPIDATNYVCYDLGQPMHCFDADKINGDIIVRSALAGEKFTDLFGAEHELIETDLVISDTDGILALAGVIGGARGMTTDTTANIILECAYFDSVTIRKTAKRLGIQSDSSYRYERGIDPNLTKDALASAVKIITNACGGKIVGNFIAGRDMIDPVKIIYNPGLFIKKTGIDISSDQQKTILENLGFAIDTGDEKWIVTPTSARVNIEIPENIVSEIIRLYGYDNIKQNHDAARIGFKTNVLSVKKKLIARGFFECLNYGFGDSRKEKILSDKPSVHILNPIIDTFDTVRNSLVQSMLDVIADNDRFRRSNMSLFELASVFDGSSPGQQHDQLVMARTGLLGNKIGIKHGVGVSIYDIRADLLALFPGAVSENDTKPAHWAHPFRAGRIILNGKTVAQFAELHPAIAKTFGIKTNVIIGLIDDVCDLMGLEHWESDAHTGIKKITLAELPLITRDFAFIASADITPTDLTEVALCADSRIIETNIFDVFDMGDGKKSIAFEIVIQPTENMSDTDLMTVQNSVIAQVEKSYDAKIRDK